MKSFIINTARGVASQKRKHDVTSRLMGREWRLLTDDPSFTGKYIFLKDGKLLMSVNGLSTYSTWQMATESILIMDEGVASFLYKMLHIDENLVVLNLDGTDSSCFLINEATQSLANASLEDIQWYLYRNSEIDLLTESQKHITRQREVKNTHISTFGSKDDQSDNLVVILLITLLGIAIVFVLIIATR